MEDGGATLNDHIGSFATDLDPNELSDIIEDCDDYVFTGFVPQAEQTGKTEEGGDISDLMNKVHGLAGAPTADPDAWYFLMHYAWKALHSDSIIISEADSLELMSYLDETSVPEQYSILESVRMKDFSSALEQLASFEPQYSWDESMYNVMLISASERDASGFLVLTETDSAFLLSVVLQTTAEGGIAVHYARALLDTIVPSDIPADFEERILSPEYLKVFPNPATYQLHISVKNPSEDDFIEIYNTMGMRIISQHPIVQGSDMEVDISQLNNGLYMLKITRTDGAHQSAGFIKY